MALGISANVEHSDYLKLIRQCEDLKKENAKLKAELKKATAKTETKKGGKQ